MSRSSEFYDREYSGDSYAPESVAEQHPFFPTLSDFVREFRLSRGRCLELGSGRGAFQDLVPDYTGVDLSESARQYYHKPFVCASGEELPFGDGSFDAAWSYAVLEHVPHPERALAELRRVLRPGGLLLLHAAWYCRPWAAEGYPVRPWSDFDLRGKLLKASIPFREHILARSAVVFPRRTTRVLQQLRDPSPAELRYKRLTPNYDHFWMADSDAIASIDPFEVLLWFTSRGDSCVSHPLARQRFLFRTGPFIIRKASSA